MVENLTNAGSDVQVLKKVQIRTHDGLTNRQTEVLKTALKMGYYDTPRKTTIRSIAKTLNVSHSTVAEILQRTEGKIVRDFLTNTSL